jgi:hypothetical protein
MSELDDSFSKLLGRQPTDKEKQNLYKIRDALGLKNNDALWLVLMALEHYETQYKRFPKLIAKYAAFTLEKMKTTAETSIQASVEETKKQLADAVAKTAKEVAYNTSRTEKYKWQIACAILSALAVIVIFFAGYFISSGKFESAQQAGYDVGYEQGIKKAIQESKELEVWTKTSIGELVLKMQNDSPGFLEMIVLCNEKGWNVTQKKNLTWCSTQFNNNDWGWPLPAGFEKLKQKPQKLEKQ